MLAIAWLTLPRKISISAAELKFAVLVSSRCEVKIRAGGTGLFQPVRLVNGAAKAAEI
jgi:hypothetical protein